MIRTLPVFKATIARAAIALAATGLLAGCITGDYAYRNGGRGDYYYGQPSVDYRYEGYGGYGHYPYGDAYRFRSRYGYPYGGYPYHRGYPYYGGHYGYPYHYPYRPRPPVVIRPPRPDGSVPPPQHRPDGRPPWRNLDELRRRQQARGGNEQPQMAVPARPTIAEPRRAESRMDQLIRRSSEARPRESDERHEP
ncbi:hypothetical protein ACFQZQ_10045 [Lysobacter koreensis]|uniref:Lipoprotein n=1 Tax=Lysobacter koreensis TaxID=266122 RepID=A0ABW2YNL8_9GAMM